MEASIKIGTKVVAVDGCQCPRVGQVCDIESSRWGTNYVVMMQDGSVEYASSFMSRATIGQIGWYVATDAMLSVLA